MLRMRFCLLARSAPDASLLQQWVIERAEIHLERRNPEPQILAHAAERGAARRTGLSTPHRRIEPSSLAVAPRSALSPALLCSFGSRSHLPTAARDRAVGSPTRMSSQS